MFAELGLPHINMCDWPFSDIGVWRPAETTSEIGIYLRLLGRVVAIPT